MSLIGCWDFWISDSLLMFWGSVGCVGVPAGSAFRRRGSPHLLAVCLFYFYLFSFVFVPTWQCSGFALWNQVVKPGNHIGCRGMLGVSLGIGGLKEKCF